ncbi:SHORT HYPOCOTYL IN WHITE LIGHT 1-like [Olea europaea subsp. europaea]|uniref:SHORT HYPOCOTYL IN WHITE LIGHT 1-like n=1 Tax=Olea europaea subsp. europaea TaxID=158383 RepID=A0A8S0RWQ0_OLEEU|nr:SHORT HYPOCOTYL IN WHITE LIGHT 1-like [Olea europaea subsp. europaea]
MAATAVILHHFPLSCPSSKISHSQISIPTVLRFQHHCLNTPLLQEGQSLNYDWRTRGVNPRSGVVMGDYGYIDDDDEEDEGDEEEDRSLDLLIRFVENIFRKVSRKARKAVRSVLPVPISAQLVGFAVNGVIILTFLWVLKAFLEVICSFGSAVFVSILLIRGIWTGISYFQESRMHRADDDDPHTWSGTKPAI